MANPPHRCPWAPHTCPLAESQECDAKDGDPCIFVAALRASEVAAQAAGTLMRLLPEKPMEDTGTQGAGVEGLEQLTPRQREVLRELLSGSRLEGIARDLRISVHTVRNHLNAIFDKTDTHSQDELVRRFRSLRPLV